MKVLGATPLIPVKYLVPFLVALLALDSMVKELLPKIPGLDSVLIQQIQAGAFYILPPLLVAGSILLFPYARSRLAIVSPRSVTRSLLVAMIGISLFAGAVLGIMYYLQSALGGAAINSSALLVKDVILAGGIGAFSLRGFRLLQWYRRIHDFVVLAFALSSFGVVSFAAFHLIIDYVANTPPTTLPMCLPLNTPCLVLNGIATSFIAFVILTHTGLIMMLRAYFGGFGWIKFTVIALSAPALFVPNLIRLGYPQLHVQVNPPLSLIMIFGFIMAGPVLLWAWYLLAPLFRNPLAKDYFKTFAYSYGLFAGATCGIGLLLPVRFPLSGYASLFAFFASAALSFAAFTSSATYFSISEDIRREIRKSEVLISSIGDAESMMSTDRKVNDFYDRFKKLAKESGAVEESAFSKDEIYSLATAVKKTQDSETKT